MTTMSETPTAHAGVCVLHRKVAGKDLRTVRSARDAAYLLGGQVILRASGTWVDPQSSEVYALDYKAPITDVRNVYVEVDYLGTKRNLKPSHDPHVPVDKRAMIHIQITFPSDAVL